MVGRQPERSLCIGAPCIVPGVGIASQTKNREMPGAWNVGGIFLYGWEERGCQYGTGVNGGWSAAARHRRLGIASGGFGLTAERKRADTVGAAGGVGDSESVAVKDSLWPQGVEAVVNPQLAREVTEDWSEWRLQSIDPKAEAVFSRS